MLSCYRYRSNRNTVYGNFIINLGILELHIQDELRVEGALHSNGERGLDSLAGGGAGGAVLIFVNHLDGEGTIEAKGGN